jgi:proliferating cell nuclear antigen
MKSDIKTEYDKYFKIPLTVMESELLSIPETDYDVEFSIPSKKIHEITSQLMFFGDVMNVECTEEKISLGSTGSNGDMNVVIKIDDLSEYSISEGEIVKVSYSLHYIHKMCITNKISNEVNFSVSPDYPLKINYQMDKKSNLVFYIAPKINDD